MKDYLGSYKVNEKIFFDKIEAILEANHTNADISWDFHQDKFRKVDWRIEPALSLRELFKIRAQQIRDEYDYVVIMFSGGADSTNVLYSFLNNNIKIDEIVAGIPLSGLRDFKASLDTNSANNASEWLLTTMPALQTVSQNHPEIKISINDFFENMLEFKTDEWIMKSSDFVHPTTAARYRLDKLTHLKALADQGKKIAIIYGSEKPQVQLIKGHFISTIYDVGVNVPRQPFEDFYDNADIVLFYSTPTMPEILIKQSHEIIKAIHLQPRYEYIKGLMFNHDSPPEVRAQYENSSYQRAIVPIIYPDLDMTKVFQAKKSKDFFMADHDNWFHDLHKDTRINQLVISDFENFYKSINPKYLFPKGSKNGFINYRNSYVIGSLEKFKELYIKPSQI